MAHADFMAAFDELAARIHRNAVNKGFWEGSGTRNTGEMIALMHSELSEALEAERVGNPVSDKIPYYTGLEEELADCIIRIMDFATGTGLNVAGAIIEKVAYNEGRPYKHGKKF